MFLTRKSYFKNMFDIKNYKITKYPKIPEKSKKNLNEIHREGQR